MFSVYQINEAIMGQSSRGSYPTLEEAIERAVFEDERSRSFVYAVVLAPNGKRVYSTRQS